MARVALPRIGGILDERQSKIDDNLDVAQNLRNEAEAEAEAYEKTLAEAREQARQSIQQANLSASEESARRHEDLAAKMNGQIKDAETRIASAKEAAVSGIRDVAAETAAAIMERLIGTAPGDDAVNAAVDTAMKEER